MQILVFGRNCSHLFETQIPFIQAFGNNWAFKQSLIGTTKLSFKSIKTYPDFFSLKLQKKFALIQIFFQVFCSLGFGGDFLIFNFLPTRRNQYIAFNGISSTKAAFRLILAIFQYSIHRFIKNSSNSYIKKYKSM